MSSKRTSEAAMRLRISDVDRDSAMCVMPQRGKSRVNTARRSRKQREAISQKSHHRPADLCTSKVSTHHCPGSRLWAITSGPFRAFHNSVSAMVAWPPRSGRNGPGGPFYVSARTQLWNAPGARHRSWPVALAERSPPLELRVGSVGLICAICGPIPPWTSFSKGGGCPQIA